MEKPTWRKLKPPQGREGAASAAEEEEHGEGDAKEAKYLQLKDHDDGPEHVALALPLAEVRLLELPRQHLCGLVLLQPAVVVPVDAAPGRIISWRSTFYMKADATEVEGFLIRDDKLEALARVSYDQARRRR